MFILWFLRSDPYYVRNSAVVLGFSQCKLDYVRANRASTYANGFNVVVLHNFVLTKKCLWVACYPSYFIRCLVVYSARH